MHKLIVRSMPFLASGAALVALAVPPVALPAAQPTVAQPTVAQPTVARPVAAPAALSVGRYSYSEATYLDLHAVARPAHPVAAARFTPTPVISGHPQWTPNSRVSYSLKNFTQAQATIIRSALKENGEATRVTYHQVTRGATLTLVKHKLYATQPDGSQAAAPQGVVGLGGPTWKSSGVIVSGAVQISPAANKIAAGLYRSLILHEVGHACGLQHSQHETSVMYPSPRMDSPTHYSTEDLASLKPR